MRRELLYYWSFQEYCNKKKGYARFFEYKRTGDHLCLFKAKNEIIIAVDETDTGKEWLSNFDMAPVINGFHHGFYTVAFKFYVMIKEALRDLTSYDRNMKVTVQGWSRGGGIAPIIDYLLRKDGYTNTQTVTFAAPRCTTLKGRRNLIEEGVVHHRVEAGLDIVDNVPPRLTIFPPRIWKHHTSFIYKLPGVKGIDHANIKQAIKEYLDG